MSKSPGIIDLQVETLLAELRRQQETQCRELLQKANSRATQLMRRSRRQLRVRGRRALAAERMRREVALRQARNRIRAQESQRVQKLYAELLRQAWPQLIEQLERRWSEEVSRREWCEMLLDEAAGVLAAADWIIEHPPGWSQTDTRCLATAMEERGLPGASLAADPAIRAGLRIKRGSACVDGTIDGLLARRGRIEARLLAAWEHESQRHARGRND